MSTIIVACKTMEDELGLLMKGPGPELPVFWIPSGLHNVPANLHTCLQQTLDGLPPADRVLLAMGSCGNSLVGIHCTAPLIVPRADDCVSLLLGSAQSHALSHKGVYFMTAGWLRGERNLMAEYEDLCRKYGKGRADRVFARMLLHFTDLALLDTGTFPLAPARAETQAMARRFSLGYREIPADLSFLRQLLTGPWPEDRFLCLEPGQILTAEML